MMGLLTLQQKGKCFSQLAKPHTKKGPSTKKQNKKTKQEKNQNKAKHTEAARTAKVMKSSVLSSAFSFSNLQVLNAQKSLRNATHFLYLFFLNMAVCFFF